MFNGMKIYTPRTTSGIFEPYRNEVVIIVAKEKNLGKVYLTNKIDEYIGCPVYIHVGVRGNNLFIWSADADDMRGYKVCQDKKRPATLRWISISAAIKENHINFGIYRAVLDNKTVSFDFYQTPSRI